MRDGAVALSLAGLVNHLTLASKTRIHEVDTDTIVRVLYIALLGRDPDPAGLRHYVSSIDSGSKTLNQIAFEFVTAFNSEEGAAVHPYESWDRMAVAFIHLGKTGGATLQSLLSKCVPISRICPVR